MKAKELREIDYQELVDKESSLRQDIFNLRFQKATGQLANTSSIGKTRKELARVKTILNEQKK
ncbi:MAG: 50S ribosomal protein L29 [Deltaproteobacteria bacterium]|nr:50S ribosomal protein L29 [Deltaproteobacteria bacterium]